MARDYTKYSVKGLGEGLNKRQVVLHVLRNYIKRLNPDFSALSETFPPTIQGSLGVFQLMSDVTDPKRFNVNEPLTLGDGLRIVVTNQWGKSNIESFINRAVELGYDIQINEDTRQKVANDNMPGTQGIEIGQLNVPELGKILENVNDLSEFEDALLAHVDLHIDFWSYLMVYDWEVNDGDLILAAERMDLAEETLDIEWSDLCEEEISLVQFVLDKLDLTFEEVQSDKNSRILFSASFGSYLYFALQKFACELEEDDLAAFLASNDHSMTREGSNVFSSLGLADDWVADMADMWLTYCGFNPSEFEGDEVDVRLIDGSVKSTTIDYHAMADEVVARFG